jgi:hypothetical protein
MPARLKRHPGVRVYKAKEQDFMRTRISIGGLFADLKQQTKTFLQEEIQLAKAELLEKTSKLGKDATLVAIGGFVAYAGVIVFLGGLGMVLAFAFERAGLHPALAAFLGLGIIGLIVTGAGVGVLLGGIKSAKKLSLKPQRTIETLQLLKGDRTLTAETPPEQHDEPASRSPEELEVSVLRTESEMADTLQELTDKVTLKEFRGKANTEIHEHPYRWGLVAIGLGLAGGYLIERNLLHRGET